MSKQNPKEKPKKKSSPLGCLSTLLVPLLCVVAVLCWKKDEVACHVLRGQLAKRFPEFRFDIGAVRLESSGASVSRLNVFLPAQGGFPETPLFGAEEIRVEVPLSISTILEKKFVPRHVLISRPTVMVNDRTMAAVGALSKGGEPVKIPYVPVDIRGASVEITLPAKNSGGQPHKMVYSGIDAALTPPSAGGPGPAAAQTAPQQTAPQQTPPQTPPSAAPAQNGSGRNTNRRFGDDPVADGLAAVSLIGDVLNRERASGTASAQGGNTNRRFGDDPVADGMAALSLVGDVLNREKASAPESAPAAQPAPVDPTRWQIRGTCENSIVKGVTFDGNAAPDFSAVTITGRVDALELGQRILSPLLDLSGVKDKVQSFTGRTSFGFTVEWNAERGLNYKVDGNLFQGSLNTPLLSHPISDLYAHFRFDPTRAEIDRLTARSGPAVILAEFFGDGTPFAWRMRAQFEDLPIDQSVLKLLPDGSGRDRLGPLADLTFAGVAKINLTLHGVDKTIARPVLSVSCKDLALSHQVFPFKPDPLSGNLQLDDAGRLRFLFKSEGETRRLCLSGEYPDVGQRRGTVRLDAERLPIDAKLIASMDDDFRDVIEELHPGGYLSAAAELKQNGADPDELYIDMRLDDASIVYDLFPMPVTGITGRVTCENGKWRFSDLRGRSGSALFTAEGTAACIGGVEEFSMTVHAERFPLGEDFTAALIDPQQRELVEKLHLRGAADAEIRMTYIQEEDRLDLRVDGATRPEETSFKPEHFPYELTNLEGNIRYGDGLLTIDDLRGENGLTAVTAAVRAEIAEDGSYTVRVAPFAVDQIQVDHSLQSAVPSRLYAVFDELALSGSYNATGLMQWHAPSADAPVEFAWNSELVLFRNGIECGKPITDISGKVALCGYACGEDAAVYGYLDIDSLFIGGVQASQVRGPVYFDGKDVLLGTAVPLPRDLDLFRRPLLRELTVSGAYEAAGREGDPYAAIPRRPISASIFHGGATLSGTMTPSPSQAYNIEFRLQEANLDEAVRDLDEHAEVLPGQVSLFANVQGEGKNWDTAKGSGGLAIKNASLYQVPLMIQILKSFSINESDSSGFNTAFVDYQIYGTRLKLDRVLLEGSSITLFGDGYLDLKGDQPQIDLTLSSRFGQVRDQLPLVSDVLGTAGDQIAQIKVEGPLSNAEIRRDNFPGIKKAVWSIFPGSGKKPK
ncbi:MAG: AsmA-like C-terminal domain-containing protein [Thermoguttaceae bacterium]|nr:AsmA-like C-terminal domain-containing protein [Thermoguttaceae bacterium]